MSERISRLCAMKNISIMNEMTERGIGWLLLLVLIGLAGPVVAEEGGWDEWLAGRISTRWNDVQAELRRIEGELVSLPVIPREELGGTGGLLTQVRVGEPEREIEVTWNKPVPVDLVVLAPARKYDVNGLILDYGLPADFSVELIGAAGTSNIPVAVENNVHSAPVRRGYPFVYPLDKPAMAIGLRVRAHQLYTQERTPQDVFILALSEVFCFSKGRNVALNAQVHIPQGPPRRQHWHWRLGFLVDGQSSLGLPEFPDPSVRGIGWLSRVHASELDSVWVVIDLGQSRRVDGLRLYPARRPSLGNIPGFGMPRRFRIRTSESGIPASYSTVLDQTGRDMKNPGHNPIELHFPAAHARFIRIETTKLWKPYDDYPAFLALSEIEVLNGDANMALGAKVVSSDQTGRYAAHAELFWSEDCLTDGFGPQGRLVNPVDWLLGLDKRLQMEKKKQALLAEAKSIVDTIRRSVFGIMLVLGGGGLFFSVILPVRYRLLRKRDVSRVRERIAGDLHDEVGSNLGCVQVLSDLVQQQSPTSRELKTIRRIAAETVTAVRDIVWLLRARADERVCIADHLKESGGILLESLEWTFEADASFAHYDVSDEKARNLMLFYREALHNVIRHAAARNVAIRMERIDSRVVLSISDDGCGIPPERLESPSMLHALKQRAKQLHGVLDVVSEPGKGTAVTLTFPA